MAGAFGADGSVTVSRSGGAGGQSRRFLALRSQNSQRPGILPEYLTRAGHECHLRRAPLRTQGGAGRAAGRAWLGGGARLAPLRAPDRRAGQAAGRVGMES
jgi:hypothetical protein